MHGDLRRRLGLLVSSQFAVLLMLAMVLPANAAGPAPAQREALAVGKAVVPCPALPGSRTTMFDSAYAPDDEQLRALRHSGARLFAGYIYSPDALNPWSRSDFDRARAARFDVIPIFVGPSSGSTAARGRADAVQTIAGARKAGFTAGPIILDVEPYALEDDPAGIAGYTAAWSAAVRQAGYSPWGYGLAAYFRTLTVAGDATSVDVAWVAAYPDDPPADPDAHTAGGVPSDWDGHGQRMWQYEGSAAVGGTTVDVSVADSGVGRQLRTGNC
jgi:hypothetical protein